MSPVDLIAVVACIAPAEAVVFDHTIVVAEMAENIGAIGQAVLLG